MWKEFWISNVLCSERWRNIQLWTIAYDQTVFNIELNSLIFETMLGKCIKQRYEKCSENLRKFTKHSLKLRFSWIFTIFSKIGTGFVHCSHFSVPESGNFMRCAQKESVLLYLFTTPQRFEITQCFREKFSEYLGNCLFSCNCSPRLRFRQISSSILLLK